MKPEHLSYYVFDSIELLITDVFNTKITLMLEWIQKELSSDIYDSNISDNNFYSSFRFSSVVVEFLLMYII